MAKRLHPLLLLLFFINLSAQNDLLKKISDDLDYGVKFGLSASRLASGDNNFDVRASFLAGFTAEYPITKKYNLKLEALYLRQGESNRNDLPQQGLIENNLKLDYLNIPILVSYPILENLRVESGLGMSFLLRAQKEIITQNMQDFSKDSSNLRKFDLNFNLGLYYPTTWNFVLGLRYSRGLIDVTKNDNVLDSSAFNSIFQLSLEYRF